MIRYSVPCVVLFLISGLCPAMDVYLGGGAMWNHFALDRLQSDETLVSPTSESAEPSQSLERSPPYYGMGGQLEAGLGLHRDLHMGVFFMMSPAQLRRAQCCRSHAQLAGAGISGRWFIEDFYLGLRAGQWEYRLIHSTQDDEVQGAWKGMGYGIQMGGLWRPQDNTLVSLGLFFDQMSLSKFASAEDTHHQKRDLSSFGIVLSTVWLIPVDSVSLW